MIKTPLRYPGGKSKVAEYLVGLFPEYKEYREPFLGGGSVFLAAMQKNPDAQFFVGDLYYDLFCFWSCLMDNPDDIVGRVRKIKEEYGSDGRKLYDHTIKAMDVVRNDSAQWLASDFFVLNRITFSGTSLSGGYSDESFRKRFTESSIKRLEEVGRYLHGFKPEHLTDRRQGIITCADFENVIFGSTDGVLTEDVGDDERFVFLDPPYYSAEDSGLYGENGDLHKGFDHERLKGCLDRCGCKFLMTYDDCEYIRNLYKGYYIIPLEFSYGMRNVSKDADMKGREIIISNYKIKDNSKSIELF